MRILGPQVSAHLSRPAREKAPGAHFFIRVTPLKGGHHLIKTPGPAGKSALRTYNPTSSGSLFFKWGRATLMSDLVIFIRLFVFEFFSSIRTIKTIQVGYYSNLSDHTIYMYMCFTWCIKPSRIYAPRGVVIRAFIAPCPAKSARM